MQQATGSKLETVDKRQKLRQKAEEYRQELDIRLMGIDNSPMRDLLRRMKSVDALDCVEDKNIKIETTIDEQLF